MEQLAETGLPPNWIAVEDVESGDYYYWNEITDETTWERPAVLGVFASSQAQRISLARELQEAAAAAAKLAEAPESDDENAGSDPRAALQPVRGALMQEIASRPALMKSANYNASASKDGGPAVHPLANELQQIKRAALSRKTPIPPKRLTSPDIRARADAAAAAASGGSWWTVVCGAACLATLVGFPISLLFSMT